MRTAKYGITMLITEDEGLKEYLKSVIKHLRGENRGETGGRASCEGASEVVESVWLVG